MCKAKPINPEKLGVLHQYECCGQIISVRCSDMGVFIRMDDDFAKANGYESLTDMGNAIPSFGENLKRCVVNLDGFVWLHFDEESHDFFGVFTEVELNAQED